MNASTKKRVFWEDVKQSLQRVILKCTNCTVSGVMALKVCSGLKIKGNKGLHNS